MIDKEMLIERQKNSSLIYDGRVLHLYRDTVTLPNGHEDIREYCKHNGGVCILPLTDDGDVICVHQYRYAHSEITLEIPAGKLDSIDEDPNDAVRRELREETGAIAGKLTYLGLYYGSPALINEKIYMYLAEDLSFGECDPDDDEFLEIIKIPLNELYDMVLRGDIEDGKTQSTVLRAYELLRRK